MIRRTVYCAATAMVGALLSSIAVADSSSAPDLDPLTLVAQTEMSPEGLGSSEEMPGELDEDGAEDGSSTDSASDETESQTDEGSAPEAAEPATEASGTEPASGDESGDATSMPAAEAAPSEQPEEEAQRFPGRPDAASMTTDELWDAYAQTQGRFEGFLSESENLDPETTTGSRVYAQTIESGVELSDLLAELVSRESELSAEELQVGTDSLLTIDQVLGSLFVEIAECERGKETLGVLLEDPRIEERPVLKQSTQRWYNNAVRCVERQRVEAEISAAREQGHNEDIERLERQLTDAQAAEDDAEQAAGATEDDEDSILLSRSELMEVLRMSQSQRQEAYSGYRPPAYTGPQKEFGLAVFGAAISTPDFMLDLFFDEHASTWSDGGNFNVGFQFFVRKMRRVQHGFTFTYANLHTEDHWWVQKNAERGDAKWVENDLQPLSFAYRYEAIAPFGERERFQIYFGIDFGISIIPSGQWSQREVNNLSTLCFQPGGADPEATSGNLAPFQSGGACGPDAVRTRPDDIFGTNQVDDSVLPPVLPTFGLGLGARYMISDIVGVGIEFGYRDFYAFAGGRLEFIIAKKKSEGQIAAEAEAARVAREEAAPESGE